MGEFTLAFGGASCASGCAADLDEDADVDGKDLRELLLRMGKSGCP
ncbi:MAG: hypothetical protein Kow0092_21640 [Deferrisomatales bacterium]